MLPTITVDDLSKITLSVALMIAVITLWRQNTTVQNKAIDANAQSIADLIKAVDALRDAVMSHISKT